jgi:hypothetical protein
MIDSFDDEQRAQLLGQEAEVAARSAVAWNSCHTGPGRQACSARAPSG